ncbi:thioredoxin, mitochondrial-like [Watersipora subatra]|uniref:thioredoxin, mitochondrial-like n=1 Tax=Watersipora subatra TaxID=2589382 RepID=UPI00355BC49C
MTAKRGASLLSLGIRLAATRIPRNEMAHPVIRTVSSQRLLHTSPARLAADSPFTVINAQDENDFEDKVIRSSVPVVVDFHATWCNPCKLLAPRLEKILSEESKPVCLVKVDVDKMEDLAIKYKVQGVPAVFAFRDGKVVDKFVGLQDEDLIESFVARLVR